MTESNKKWTGEGATSDGSRLQIKGERVEVSRKAPQLSFHFDMRPAPDTTGYYVRSSQEAKDWIGPQVEKQGRECFVVVYLKPKNEGIKTICNHFILHGFYTEND